jgi:hypothetical protein
MIRWGVQNRSLGENHALAQQTDLIGKHPLLF